MAKHKILIIDDSGIIRAQIREMLPPGSFKILEAKDGIEGLHLIRQSQPNLIFVDFLAPRLNGWEIFQQLQADPILQQIPFVMMSESLEAVRAKISHPLEYFEWLEKPFDQKQLIAAIKIAFADNKPHRHLIPQEVATLGFSGEIPLLPDQPRNSDAVLGSPRSTPMHGIVLGGFEGVKQRFYSPVEAQRVAALQEAIQYGQSGLNLVIRGLADSSTAVQQTADSLLRQRVESTPQRTSAFRSYQDLECRRILMGHSCYVLSLAISPDGSTLASSSCDGTIQLWNLQTGENLHTLGDNSPWVKSVAISPDSQTLVSGGHDGTIKRWDLHTDVQKSILTEDSSSVMCLAITPNGQTLISGSHDGTIKLWDLHLGVEQQTIPGHQQEVYTIAMSPDGQTLASGSNDGTIKLWNLHTGAEKTTITGYSSVLCLAISPDGETLVGGYRDGTIKLWNLHTGVEKNTLLGHSSSVNSVAITADSHTLVSGSGDETIKLWHLQSGVELRTLVGYSFVVHCVAISPDGQTLVSGHSNGRIKLWGATF